MKIVDIKLTPLLLNFKEPYHWAGRVDLGAAVILIEVISDEGICGIGETTAPLPAEGSLALLQSLKPEIIDHSPLEVDPLIGKARFLMGVNRTPRFSALLLAGLDMALWDLAGKILKLPVFQLLGGAYHQNVDYFAFPQGDSAHELGAASRKAVQKGYSVVYVKVGRGEKKDLENVAAVRENIGDRRLRLDANGAWDPVTAVRMIRLLSSYEPEFIEQPTPPHSLAALKQVRESVNISIAADQSVFTIEEIYEVCRQQAADLLVFSPHETGGLTAFKKGAAIAAAAGLRVCLHGQFTSGITDSAQHQAALNTPNLYDGNQIMHQLLQEDLISAPCIEPQNGKLGIWKTPGLGFELNRDAVARAAERYRANAAGAHKLVS